MGEWGQCDTDYPPTAFWKDTQHEHGRTVFSIDYAGREGLFEGLSIWEHEKYRKMQGTYPVISLSFANVKETNYSDARKKICQLLTNLYVKHLYLRESDVLTDTDKEFFDRVLSVDMRDTDATLAIYQLSYFLYRYYGKKVIILLDEYDTPMQEAYVDGFWGELVAFTRSLFNASFKTGRPNHLSDIENTK